jgi:hypothetical protein
MTGPHTGSIPGLFSVGEAALAEALGWPIKGFRKAFQEVFAQGMVQADWTVRLVFLPKAIKYNEPESPNVVKSWCASFNELPECALKQVALEHIKCLLEEMGEPFAKAFGKAFAKPLPKTMANQEQEQEQEQEIGKASPTIVIPTVDAYQLAEALKSAILKRDPKAKSAKTANITAWAAEIDKLVRLDGRSSEDIRAVIEWCQTDTFWCTNVMSANTLREKFDRLWGQMQNGNRSRGARESVGDHNMRIAAEMNGHD